MTDFIVKHFIRNSEAVHTEKVRTAYGVLAGIVGILLNTLLSGTKFTIGVLSGSISMQADAVNNLADAGASVVTLVGFRVAAKPADDEHPYGHGRVEYIAGLVVAFMILLAGVELLTGAIEKIVSPTPVEFSPVTAGVLFFTVPVKIWMGRFTSKLGKRIKSNAMAAAATDSRNDVISTMVVLLGYILSHILKLPLDGYMGLMVALFVIYSGIGIVKDTSSPLLGESPDPELVEGIVERLLSYDGIEGLHDLLVHDYGPGRRLVTVHAEVAADSDILEIHETIDKAEREIAAAMNLHLTIHMDPLAVDDELSTSVKSELSAVIERVDGKLHFHDFRLVPGENCTNLIFDLVVPAGMAREQISNIKASIRAGMKEVCEGYCCVITVDSAYTALEKNKKSMCE